MSTVPARSVARNRLLLYGVDWKMYRLLLRAFEERPNVRLTYDRGTLEIMSPLYKHDHDAEMLGQLVRVLTEELGMTLAAGGSVTLRRSSNAGRSGSRTSTARAAVSTPSVGSSSCSVDVPPCRHRTVHTTPSPRSTGRRSRCSARSPASAASTG